MRFISRFLGLVVVVMALGGLTATSAFAANLVDGSISALDRTCSWANGTTSANPPSTLAIDRNSINGNLTCSSGTSAVLNNDPNVSFDDSAGTATADSIDATVTASGLSCRYGATNVTLTGDAATRAYSGSANASLVSGSFFCPGSVDLTASVQFH
jgi:hypothetical protein